MTTETTTTIETGKTYRVTYGRGHQLFHATYVSPKGKPFGLRLFAVDRTWKPSSLPINDSRLQGLAPIPADAPELPALPDKVDTKALEIEVKRLHAIYCDRYASAPDELPYWATEGISQDVWDEARRESGRIHRAWYWTEHAAYYAAEKALTTAKAWNKILPR